LKISTLISLIFTKISGKYLKLLLTVLNLKLLSFLFFSGHDPPVQGYPGLAVQGQDCDGQHGGGLDGCAGKEQFLQP
jgi:hypothetical protein